MHRTIAAVFAVAAFAPAAFAQPFAAGAKVFAAPTTSGDWYSGCTVVSGPNSNNFYQVHCGADTWWVNGERVTTTAPQPTPDPMRPGKMSVPTITPSDPAPQAAAPTSNKTAATHVAAAAKPAGMGPGSYGHDVAGPGPGNYAGAMHARIAADNKAAASVNALKPGKYTCYAGGQYTFTDLIIESATRYSDGRGNSGSYSIAGGALNFTSGPNKGAYSRMVDDHTIGLSAPGNTNLGTQCGFDK